MTVAEVERRVSSRELTEWFAFWLIEPRFSPWHAFAQVCCVIWNVHAKKPKKLRDFLPKGMGGGGEQSPATQKRLLLAWAEQYNSVLANKRQQQ